MLIALDGIATKEMKNPKFDNSILKETRKGIDFIFLPSTMYCCTFYDTHTNTNYIDTIYFYKLNKNQHIKKSKYKFFCAQSLWPFEHIPINLFNKIHVNILVRGGMVLFAE